MKAATTLILSLILATPVLADDAITVFGGGFSRDRGFQAGSSVGGTYQPAPAKTQWNGEIGLAASHAWNKWWSAEASIAYRQSHSIVSEFVPVDNGAAGGGYAPETMNREARTLPLDASMRFHLANGTRWQPYVSAGARYVNASKVLVNDFQPVTVPDPLKTKRAGDRLSAEVGAGMTLMLTRGFGVRGDYKRLLRNDDSEFDPINRATFGVEWKF